VKLAALAIAALLLAGCASPQPLRQDRELRTVLVTVATSREAPFACGEVAEAAGCTYRFYDEASCVVVVPRPQDQGDTWAMRVWGHELMHCVYGQWHE